MAARLTVLVLHATSSISSTNVAPLGMDNAVIIVSLCSCLLRDVCSAVGLSGQLSGLPRRKLAMLLESKQPPFNGRYFPAIDIPIVAYAVPGQCCKTLSTYATQLQQYRTGTTTFSVLLAPCLRQSEFKMYLSSQMIPRCWPSANRGRMAHKAAVLPLPLFHRMTVCLLTYLLTFLFAFPRIDWHLP